VFHWREGGGLLNLSGLGAEEADGLAALLVRLGHRVPGVTAEHRTAAAFAEAWQRRTGAVPTRRVRLVLHRLGALTPPEPFPPGRGRVTGPRDLDHVRRWCGEFAADVGETVATDHASWPGTRFAEKQYTFWETPDGTPVSMGGSTPLLHGHIRVDPVYTPAPHRGHGYAAAVTSEVSRTALAAGAREVVLFTNAANPTSNALYRRVGYRPIGPIDVYDFAAAAP
jgi:GNAT superfamily N-acetyltransferase